MKSAYVILLQGRPATGKTTIGRQIAAALELPFISRDTYKEVLFDAFGSNNEESIEWSKKIGAASFELTYTVINQVLSSGNSCIVETTWIPLFAEKVLKDILKRSNAGFIQVYCHSSDTVREERFNSRAHSDRHPAHMDRLRIEKGNRTKKDKHPKLDIKGFCIDIDTTHFDQVDIPEIISKVKSHLV